ncbi:carbohydrate esterase family 16 protein [Polyporus arcularius HHB13444]|uniref:Carbohydrate esterase family 16 protein n=1 Tax=Polyporus arcularius HHB13444 TaxID=1314778 RepID=A0A5C3NU18_9APHY|nr:carbohydrate esterase family 16 protein [Polyporus arcularius HHB13444]
MHFTLFVVSAVVALAAPAALAAVQTVNSGAKAHSAIIAFGDSFSDNGNGSWAITNHTWPADPHYAGGRFSNGPVWIEYVAGNLSISLVDYAIGGGYTGPGSTVPVPSVDQQVVGFLQKPPSNVSLANPLFVLFGGANDPLFDLNVTAAQSFQELMTSKAALKSAYPRADILLLSYPDLSRIPYDFYTDAQTKLKLRAFSYDLAGLLRRAQLRDKDLKYVDLIPLFADFKYYGMPAAYGFAPLGAYGSCLTGAYRETENVTVCDDPDEMVFWDEYHPTTHAHSWIAHLVLDTLGYP